ncbi:MAG: ABC transporter permease, partial [Lachnospiraceae bacterium]|nr:ABC transporter permease [Lachnospiraceae bacterium]
IIMMTALYTVNLRVAGRANLPIYNQENIFDNQFIDTIFPASMEKYKTVVIIFVIMILTKYLLDWYMNSQSGFMLRAVGDNETIVTSLGVDKGMIKIIGLSIANGLVSLSGCIFANQQRFFEISSGTGTVVIGLASVIIGTSIFKKVTFFRVTSSVIIGSLLYKACVAIAIRVIPASSDLKLVTAVLFLVILVIGTDRRKKVKKNA